MLIKPSLAWYWFTPFLFTIPALAIGAVEFFGSFFRLLLLFLVGFLNLMKANLWLELNLLGLFRLILELVIKVFWSLVLGTNQNLFFIYILDCLLAKWFRLKFLLRLWHWSSLGSIFRTFCMGALLINWNFVTSFVIIGFTALSLSNELLKSLTWVRMHIQGFILLGIVIMVGTLVISSSILAHVCGLVSLRILLNSLNIVSVRAGIFLLPR